MRTEKWRRSFYGLPDIGRSYPGLSLDIKACIWNTICQPILLYTMDCIPLSKTRLHKLESVQCNLLKQCLGFNKRTRSSHLLQTLHVARILDIIKRNMAFHIKRIFNVQSPLQKLGTHFMSLYVAKGALIPETLVSRPIESGLWTMNCVLIKLLNVKLMQSQSLWTHWQVSLWENIY